MWTKQDISAFLSYPARIESPKAPIPTVIKKIDPKTISSQAAPVPDASGTLSEIAEEFADNVEPQFIAGLVGNYESIKRIPPEIDRPLLGRSKTILGILSSEQKSEIRALFIASLKERLQKQSESKK
jgi:hypothetical protein